MKGNYDALDEATTADNGVFTMPDIGTPADPWAPVTAILWLAFTVALACAPALVWAAYRGAF